MQQVQLQKSLEPLKSKRDFSDLIGLLPNKGDSVKEVREIRKRESEKLKKLNLDDPKVVEKLLEELNSSIK